jgi:cation/acetate symporter
VIPLAAVNVEALVIFGVVLAITLVITYWASQRMTGTDTFYAAGRSITAFQNGLAISGDYLSAASFLGIAGLIYLYGFDGFLYSVGFLVAFLTVMFLLAERMRNAGKYTIADVLSFRLRERPARTAAALGTLTVAAFYLIAQMVGAGVLIQALVGIKFSLAVLITGCVMLLYVVFGGMLATTWVQIIKAVLLMAGILVMSIFVLEKVGGNPIELFNRAERNVTADSTFSLKPGTFLDSPIDTVSLGLALVLGTAGLPHILMRFFTVPDGKAARSSVVYAMLIIGGFYILTTFIGFGARAILGEGGVAAAGKGGNLAAPNLAQFLGGGEGTFGGDLFLAIIAAVAFATILAVVAGLVLSASGAVAHDIWTNVIRKGKQRNAQKEEVTVARIAAAGIGLIAITIAIIGGEGLNVSFMVGLAFAVAASANFPALLLALTWRRFNTTGAVTGVAFGVLSSIFLVIISPKVWPGADAEGGLFSFYDLANPGIISIPLGFLGCWLGTMLGKDEVSERSFDELYVRSETGLGAEGSLLRATEPGETASTPAGPPAGRFDRDPSRSTPVAERPPTEV